MGFQVDLLLLHELQGHQRLLEQVSPPFSLQVLLGRLILMIPHTLSRHSLRN
jgi:hypothetical protein